MRSRIQFILDEATTVQRLAEEKLAYLSAQQPTRRYVSGMVLRPALERWFDVALVADVSASMVIWRKTILELQRLLERHGAFRSIHSWSLTTDSSPIGLYRGSGPAALRRSPRSFSELIDPAGRRLVLVISDCVGLGWHNGQVVHKLALWVRHQPVALIQMLPERLWSGTALGSATAAYMQPRAAGAANAQFAVKREWRWFDEPSFLYDDDTAAQPAGTTRRNHEINLPVMTLEPDSLATWAEGLMSAGGPWLPGYIFSTQVQQSASQQEVEDSDQPSHDLLNESLLSADERVNTFRAVASPEAFHLAELLSTIPLTLPVMRLVHHVMFLEPRQVHLAEVFLSGLLRQVTPDAPNTDPDKVRARIQFSRSRRKADTTEAFMTFLELVPQDGCHDPLVLATNAWVRTRADAQGIAHIYSQRWAIESGFEIMKAWGLEDFMVRQWEAIEHLLWIVALAYALATVAVYQVDLGRFREQVRTILRHWGVVKRWLTVGKVVEALGYDFAHHPRAWFRCWLP